MMASGIERVAVDAVSTLFALAALLNLGGNRRLVAVYRLWKYGAGFNHFAGALELVTAVLLLFPHLRVAGAILGGIILFFSVVALLNHRQYAWSLPGMLLLAALIPVSLA